MWDKDLVDLLIVRYKQHENLYNVRHPMYADRFTRSDSLVEICKKLKELNNKITVEDIKKKIHTLRSQYIKESREIASRKRNGDVGVYEPKLWCFHKLDFLKPHCTLRKSELDNSEITYDEHDMEEEMPVEVNRELSTHGYNKRKRESKLDDRIDNVSRLLVKRLEEKTDYDWLGKQVVFEMKSIKNKKIQRDTAWKIQTILREASIEDSHPCEYQPEQLSNELQSDTQSSFDSGSPKAQPACSSFLSVHQQSDSVNNSLVQPVRLIMAKPYNASSPSIEIMQHSLNGIKEEEDFQCL